MAALTSILDLVPHLKTFTLFITSPDWQHRHTSQWPWH